MKIEIDGITKDHREWAKEYKLMPPTIMTRHRNGIRGRELLKPVPSRSEIARNAKQHSPWNSFKIGWR